MPETSALIDDGSPFAASGDLGRVDLAIQPLGQSIADLFDRVGADPPSPELRTFCKGPILDAKEYLVMKNSNCERVRNFRTC
jgi:hypothetical protein